MRLSDYNHLTLGNSYHIWQLTVLNSILRILDCSSSDLNRIMDRKCLHFYRLVAKTANACTSMDMLSKLPTLAVQWMVLGPAGQNVKKLNIVACYQNCQR